MSTNKKGDTTSDLKHDVVWALDEYLVFYWCPKDTQMRRYFNQFFRIGFTLQTNIKCQRKQMGSDLHDENIYCDQE